MSNQRKKERRAEIAVLREEGRQAFFAGRHIQTVPKAYLRTENRYQWEQGWRIAAFEQDPE